MEIRNEMEKLKADPSTPLAATYNSGIEDALSILDKWERVGEYPWTDNKSEEIESLIGKQLVRGDHIIIWRRKDE